MTHATLAFALAAALLATPASAFLIIDRNVYASEYANFASGQYVLLVEFESVELRDRYFPASGEASEEWQRLAAPFAAELEQIGTLTTWPDAQFTDYTVVAQTK